MPNDSAFKSRVSRMCRLLMLTGHDTSDNVKKARIHKISGFTTGPPEAESLALHMEKALGL